MDIAGKLVLDTIVLVLLLAFFFWALYAPIRLKRPIPYIGGLFLLNLVIAAVSLVWNQSLQAYIAVARFNRGGFLFGGMFAGLGVTLLIVSIKDHTPQKIVPIMIIFTGLAIAVLSSVS